MKNRLVRKGALAVGVALSLVALSAGPAGSGELVSGTIDFGDPVQWSFEIGGGTEDPPCDPGPKGFPFLEPDPYPEVDFDIDGDDESGEWWTTGLVTGTFQLDTQWYQITYLFDDFPPGFTTGPSGTYQWDPIEEHWELDGGGTIWFVVEEINIPDPPDPEEPCDKKEEVCFGFVEGVLVPPSYYEGPWPPGPGGSVTINAESVAPHVQTSGCQQPWLAVHGEPVNLVDVVIDL